MSAYYGLCKSATKDYKLLLRMQSQLSLSTIFVLEENAFPADMRYLGAFNGVVSLGPSYTLCAVTTLCHLPSISTPSVRQIDA